ncbi:MAG TPA: GNAT family protein [Cytophagaceae bacterium]|jgi:RimJ/RimL family protein N-acetyltransferase
MIHLSKLEQSDFDTFKAWVRNKDELLQFAGSIFQFPVTDEQLLKYITDERRVVFKVVLTATNEMIGNAELNYENLIPRLSRILIGDMTNRNKGLGKQIVNKMLEKLFIEDNFLQADLNVFDWNAAAIKCYQQIGFTINPDIINKQCNGEKIWTAINMKVLKDNWMEAIHKNRHH